MESHEIDLGFGGGSLLQIANRSGTQMMSYLIETDDHRLVMIDGGYCCEGDGEYLRTLIHKKGGHIDAWFMSHAHEDHFGALLYILENGKFDFTIDHMYFSFPPIPWLASVENGEPAQWTGRLYSQFEKNGIIPETLHTGGSYTFGRDAQVKIEVLCDGTGYNSYNSVNDTTAVLKLHYPLRDVLLLGDMGTGGQGELISLAGDKLRCDIVQMAHHGQNGVDKSFYELVAPKICLWCAPDWLWDNNKGEGKGSGPWNTLLTRQWMEQLNVKQHYVIAFGDYLFK